MQSILDITLEYAAKYNAKKVTKISLEIGELSGFIPDWMQTYFNFVSEGTIAEKAELCIEHIPAVIKCKLCEKEYQLTKESFEFICPECGDEAQIEILSGKEYNLKSIEVD
jgi:hydrogenase nickel incorporation protein HypA/HybF